MTKEYDAGTTKEYPAYSNINSYANNVRPVSIVAPMPAYFLPEIFYHAKPHPLPQWMKPKKHFECDNCNSYSVFGDSLTNCDQKY